LSSRADFLVSYASSDRSWAEWIAWQLEDEGYQVVVQAWDFSPGRDWAHEMHMSTSLGGTRTAHEWCCWPPPGDRVGSQPRRQGFPASNSQRPARLRRLGSPGRCLRFETSRSTPIHSSLAAISCWQSCRRG
jgi:hypothetical protein